MTRTLLTLLALASSTGCLTPRVLAGRDRCYRVARPGSEVVQCKPADAPGRVEECDFPTREADRVCPGELFVPETPSGKAPPAAAAGAP